MELQTYNQHRILLGGILGRLSSPTERSSPRRTCHSCQSGYYGMCPQDMVYKDHLRLHGHTVWLYAWCARISSRKSCAAHFHLHLRLLLAEALLLLINQQFDPFLRAHATTLSDQIAEHRTGTAHDVQRPLFPRARYFGRNGTCGSRKQVVLTCFVCFALA